MSDIVKVAILGLGSLGEEFAENFLEIIQIAGKPVEIVAVSHDDLESAVALGFSQSKVPVYENPLEVLQLGDTVDIIFDLTDDSQVRQGLREGMRDTNNQHTVIAPEIMAKLVWMFFDSDGSWNDQMEGGY